MIIPEIKKEKISIRINKVSENQYFSCTKEENMNVTCFNVVLDSLLTGLNDRYNQETLKLILSIINILKLGLTQEDMEDVFK